MMRKLIIAAALAAFPTLALAQIGGTDMQTGITQMGISPMDNKVQHDHAMMEGSGAGNPSALAFIKINQQMHKNMAVKYSGDTDVDFVRGMIPHHQGAVDMAKVEIQSGTDPEIKELATAIIESQNKEIEFMKKWLAAHDKK